VAIWANKRLGGFHHLGADTIGRIFLHVAQQATVKADSCASFHYFLPAGRIPPTGLSALQTKLETKTNASAEKETRPCLSESGPPTHLLWYLVDSIAAMYSMSLIVMRVAESAMKSITPWDADKLKSRNG
jgi:hypothetical protein